MKMKMIMKNKKFADGMKYLVKKKVK